MSTHVKIGKRARARLAALEDQHDVAVTVVNDANARLKELQGSLINRPATAEDERLDEMRALRERREQYVAHRHRVGGVLGRIRGWISTLPPNAVLHDLDLPTCSPRKGEQVADAVDRVREDLAVLQRERVLIERAPLPREMQERALSRWIADQAVRVKPSIHFTREGEAVVDVAVPDSGGPSRMVTIALMAWHDHRAMFERLSHVLDDLPDAERARCDDEALLPHERDRRLAEIDDDLERQGLIEQVLLDQAGGSIPQRPDVDPRIVLGVGVSVRPATASAA